MKKLIGLAFVIMAVCLVFAACGCEHEYEQKITTKASCASVGIKTFTCTKCEDSYTEEIPMIEHSFGTATVTKEATCIAEGEKIDKCSVCGKTEIVSTPKTSNHEYKEEIVKQATCAQTGTKKSTCQYCGDTKTEAVPKTNEHSTKLGKCTVCNSLRTEMLPTAKNIADKYVAGMDELNDSLEYVEKALNSKRYSGTLNAVACLGFANGQFKAAIELCGNDPEFAAIKKELQTASNRITNAFPKTVSSYGDYRDLETLRTVLDTMDAISSNLKKIQNIVNEWETYD